MDEPSSSPTPPPSYDERISETEEHFERWHKRLGFWLDPPMNLVVALSDENNAAQHLAGIITFAAI